MVTDRLAGRPFVIAIGLGFARPRRLLPGVPEGRREVKLAANCIILTAAAVGLVLVPTSILSMNLPGDCCSTAPGQLLAWPLRELPPRRTPGTYHQFSKCAICIQYHYRTGHLAHNARHSLYPHARRNIGDPNKMQDIRRTRCRARVLLLAAMRLADIPPDRRKMRRRAQRSVAMVTARSDQEGVDVDISSHRFTGEQAIRRHAPPSLRQHAVRRQPLRHRDGHGASQQQRSQRRHHCDISTQSRIEAIVGNAGRCRQLRGKERIDRVPGTASRDRLNFMDIVGSRRPPVADRQAGGDRQRVKATLHRRRGADDDRPAADLSKTGYMRSAAELDADRILPAPRAWKRCAWKQTRRMGLGDVINKGGAERWPMPGNA